MSTNTINLIKALRKEKKLTQMDASALTGVPLRTFKVYENDPEKIGSIKYNYIVQELSNYKNNSEEFSVLEIADIKNICMKVLPKYDVEYCILFGSYAKGLAGENSDIDLIVSTKLTGLKFFGLAEDLRRSLGREVDLLDTRQLKKNINLVDAIMREGIRIYER